MSTGRRAYDLLRGYVNREWERIQGVEQTYAELELEQALRSPGSAATTPRSPTELPLDNQEHARRLLGVKQDADFESIRKAFERLNQRSDPSNFPSGSQERVQAADIQRKIQWAYQILSENVDATERRFRSLEID